MKVYALKDRDGLFTGNHAYINRHEAEKIVEIVKEHTCISISVEEYEVAEYTGKTVFFVLVYRGFDYPSVADESIDIFEQSKIYSTIELAKTDTLWVESTHAAEKEPSSYIISENQICSTDRSGKPWKFGNVYEEKFDTKIRQLSVE